MFCTTAIRQLYSTAYAQSGVIPYSTTFTFPIGDICHKKLANASSNTRKHFLCKLFKRSFRSHFASLAQILGKIMYRIIPRDTTARTSNNNNSRLVRLDSVNYARLRNTFLFNRGTTAWKSTVR